MVSSYMAHMIWLMKSLVKSKKRERNHNYKWERKFKCDYCDYTFDTIGSLRKSFSEFYKWLFNRFTYGIWKIFLLKLEKKSQYSQT